MSSTQLQISFELFKAKKSLKASFSPAQNFFVFESEIPCDMQSIGFDSVTNFYSSFGFGGCRQVVRQRTVTSSFAGSNPVIHPE